MIYHLDYETRSAIDLTEVGAFKYAQHHSTRILIASLAKGDGKPATWSVLDPDNADFALLADELAHDPDPVVYAHNSQFEAALTEFCHDGPGLRVPASAWRCTAAMARRAGLRSKLEHLSEDLGLVMAKDPKGKALIRFFSIPEEGGAFNEPKDHPEKFAAFVSYCERDVEAEQEVGAKLAFFDLKGEALKVFQFDSRLNRRGIPVNVPALWHAKAIIDEVDARLGKQFYELTGLRQAQRAKVFAWLQARGYTGADMTSDTVAEQLLRTDWEPAPYTGDAPDGGMGRDALAREYARAREALRLYSQLAFAAAKKVEAMLASVCEDGTVKGSFLYYGAGTGRWAGRGIQPQNFKKPTIPVADLPAAFDLIASGSATAEVLELMFGVPALETVASCVRNFIGPDGGLLDADYAAIEARIVNWGAGQDDVLDLFRKGADLYIRMAARIYGIPEAQVPKKGNMRQLGKAAILGCGYGMGAKKFYETCLSWGIEVSADLAEQAVKAYRSTHPKVTAFWRDLDWAAKDAVQNPGKWFLAAGGKARFIVREAAGMPYLFMVLPSGRAVAYPKPEVKRVFKEAFNDHIEELSYWGQVKSFMGRIGIYGGKWAENWTQAVAADVMATGATNAEAAGFDVFALIHDQALAANDPRGVKPFVAALTKMPDWADGMPLAAEGNWATYYTKD